MISIYENLGLPSDVLRKTLIRSLTLRPDQKTKYNKEMLQKRISSVEELKKRMSGQGVK
jgi:hypothetical protein